MEVTINTLQQEKNMLVELQRRKQLFTSLFFSTLTHREMNSFVSHMMMWTLAAEKITELVISGLELDEYYELDTTDYSEPAYCSGSRVSFPRSSPSVLCYCGRRFNRRFDSIKDTWRIPLHSPSCYNKEEKNLSCGSDSRNEQSLDTPNIISSFPTTT